MYALWYSGKLLGSTAMVLTGLRTAVTWLLDVDPCRVRSRSDGGGIICGRLLVRDCGMEPMKLSCVGGDCAIKGWSPLSVVNSAAFTISIYTNDCIAAF